MLKSIYWDEFLVSLVRIDGCSITGSAELGEFVELAWWRLNGLFLNRGRGCMRFSSVRRISRGPQSRLMSCRTCELRKRPEGGGMTVNYSV